MSIISTRRFINSNEELSFFQSLAANLLGLKTAFHSLQLTSDAEDSRDTPEGLIVFKNVGLPNNPKIGIGNPYIAGIGLVAGGFWYTDDTLEGEWKIIFSFEQSGTVASVLDGTRRSAFESFVQNGDYKPCTRVIAGDDGYTGGPGGCLALAGNVVRSGGVLTVQTEAAHNLSVGIKLWKTPAPGYAGEVATFGSNDDLWGPGGTTRTVATVVNSTTFTVLDSRADATSTEPLCFSAETDVGYGREGKNVAAIRTGQAGSMSTRAKFDAVGMTIPSGAGLFSDGNSLILGGWYGSDTVRVSDAQLTLQSGKTFDSTAVGISDSTFHIKEGKTFYNEGKYRSTGWYNGGGETQTTQEVFIVGTGSGNKTTHLPSIGGVDWVRLDINNHGQGGSNTLTITPDGSDTINGAASLVIPANAGVTLRPVGTDWRVWYNPPPP